MCKSPILLAPVARGQARVMGGFTLGYPNRSPGEKVRLGVIKEGYVVVNWVQLDLALPKDPNGQGRTRFCRPIGLRAKNPFLSRDMILKEMIEP